MSFFGAAQRDNIFVPKENPSPAQYQVIKQKRCSHAYAPFNSTAKIDRSKRQSAKKNKQDQNGQQINAFANQQMIDQKKLILLAQAQMKKSQSSMFTSRSQRFINVRAGENPGPGSYNLRDKIRDKKDYSNKKNELNQTSKSRVFKDKMKKTNPSFPIDNLGYKQLDNNDLQKVAAKKSNGAYPGAYELRKDLLLNHGLKWKTSEQVFRQNENIQPGPGSYSNGIVNSMSSKKNSLSCLNSKTDRFGGIKSKKNHVNPGPGAYLPQSQNKLNRSISQGYFNSKCPRFQNPNKYNQVPDPGTYFQTKPRNFNTQGKFKNKKSNSCFNSSNKKSSIIQQEIQRKGKIPGPGEYVNIFEMKHKLQMEMIRKFNTSQFPNQRRQVFENKQSHDAPGPGEYNPQKPNLNIKGAIHYKPVEIINLKAQTQQMPASLSPFDTSYNNFTIAEKVNQSVNRLTLTDRKPFNSGTDRFKHYADSNSKQTTIGFDSNIQMNRNSSQGNVAIHNYSKSIPTEETEKNNQSSNNLQEMNRRVKKLVMTTVKVKVPFGMSSNKYQQQQILQPGPGFYEKNNNWVKNTFNIKGKIMK